MITKDTLTPKLKEVELDLNKIVSMVLKQIAEEIMSQSKDMAPKNTGFLANSGFVGSVKTTKRRINIEIGYRANYALYVHENPRAGHTDGRSPTGKKYKTWAKEGQWKFLEVPLNNAEFALIKNIKKKFKNAVK